MKYVIDYGAWEPHVDTEYFLSATTPRFPVDNRHSVYITPSMLIHDHGNIHPNETTKRVLQSIHYYFNTYSDPSQLRISPSKELLRKLGTLCAYELITYIIEHWHYAKKQIAHPVYRHR